MALRDLLTVEEDFPLGFSSEGDVERKTFLEPVVVSATKKTDKNQISTGYNLLNNYKTYTYIFTLSALDKKSAATLSYRTSSADLPNIILKAGGKGTGTLTPTFSEEIESENDSAKKNSPLSNREEILDWFNENSAGRFDFFMDNVSIETIPTFTKMSNTTLATKISFTVQEPLSNTGFLEAIRASSLAAGYENHVAALFLLKIEFIGYKDGDDITDPEVIDKTTRYFPIRFTKMDLDVNENGSEYKCEAVPFDELAYSNLYSLRNNIQMMGNTVGEVLTDLMTQVNKSIKTEAEQKDSKNKQISDSYEIVFGKFEDGIFKEDPDSDIAKAKISELLRDRTVYAFPDPGDKDTALTNAYKAIDQKEKNSVSYELVKASISFAKGAVIHDIISSVIRDSDYLSNLLKNLTDYVDENNMVPFWKITCHIEYLDYDPETGDSFKKFKYIVTPYKVPYTLIPGQSQRLQDVKKLMSLVLRKYEYIYTGQNIDILDLKLNFNNLFFSAISRSFGVNESKPETESAAPGNTANPKNEPSTPANLRHFITGLPLAYTNAEADKIANLGGNAGPLKIDPYSILARNFFNTVLTTSAADMLKVEMQIIGDPLYVTSTGMGNYIPVVSGSNKSITEEGEVNTFNGNLYISIIFRNPIDIDSTSFSDNGTGLAKFSKNIVDFTGVYLVTNIRSEFKKGIFTQKLELVRIPGINPDEPYTEEDIASLFTSRPNPNDQVSEGQAETVPPCRSGALNDLLSGVNKLADNLQQAEARIVGAIQGAVAGISNAVNEAVSTPLQELQESTNKITGALIEVNNEVTSAVNKLGLTSNQFQSLSPQQLLAAVAISKLLPDKLNLQTLDDKKVCIPNKEALDKLPATTAADPAENANTIAEGRPGSINPLTGEEITTNFGLAGRVRAARDIII